MPIFWKFTYPHIPSVRADKGIHDALQSGQGQWTSDHLSPNNTPVDAPPAVSRSQVQRLIEEGCATINGQPLKTSTKLQPDAVIEIRFPDPKSMELVPEDRPLDILYQDEHLVVINKPPGLTVHPSATQNEGTLVHALLHHIKDLSGIGGVLRPGIVHRIDKDTSGALVITKTDLAHQKLAEVFARHQIDRKYWALCYGSPHFPTGIYKVESLIGRNPTDRKKMTLNVKDGRKAITYLKKIEEYGTSNKKPFASLIEATLETGRTHQVRVHLTSLHHSILGDPVYGSPTVHQTKWTALPKDVQAAVEKLPGQALHARVLGFDHPITGQKLYFEAEPPQQFSELLKVLKNYAS